MSRCSAPVPEDEPGGASGNDAFQVLTIGHSTRPLQEFLALLQAHSVKTLIDVRSVPRSRHSPQFDGVALARDLRVAGIGYEHAGSLGGFRHPAPDSRNTAWRNSSFRGYADYMQTGAFAASAAHLIEQAQQGRIALMCAEAVPWRCHRSLIADALTVRGVRVAEINGLARLKEHSLTSFAHVDGKTITYPGLEPAEEKDERR